MWVKYIGVFWTWSQDQWLMCCNWTFHRLENNPYCELLTKTEMSSPNTTYVKYFFNDIYTPTKSKNSYSFFFILWMIVIDVIWRSKQSSSVCTIMELITCYMHSSNIFHKTMSWTPCFILRISTKNHKFWKLDI